MATIQPNSYVTVEYVLKDDDGEILDSSNITDSQPGDEGEEEGGPIEYVHGYGMLVPGLEAALAGMTAGEKKKVTVSAEEGYGERDEELMLEIDRGEFPETVQPGDEFVAESPDGDEVVLHVVEVNEDAVLVDANHPLAGMTLHYEVDVKSVRDATENEIEAAARSLDEAHEHVHGPDCDHDHGDHAVVTLGKGAPKKPVVN
jgi:FKBP-type peptidyl-prolyl cis-trans isomerase SlyD